MQCGGSSACGVETSGSYGTYLWPGVEILVLSECGVDIVRFPCLCLMSGSRHAFILLW